jgi:hypothetical protein
MGFPVVSTATVNAVTTGLTTSFSVTQDKLTILNNGVGDVKISVGGLTDLIVRPKDTQTWNIQFTSFVATGVGATRSITYTATETGEDVINKSDLVTSRVRPLVAVADEAATLTAAQLVANSIFTQTPGAARQLTTATGAEIIAALPNYSVGSVFDFTVVNLAANTHVITVAAGASGVTVSGLATIAAATSGTFVGRIAAADAVVIYRK